MWIQNRTLSSIRSKAYQCWSSRRVHHPHTLLLQNAKKMRTDWKISKSQHIQEYLHVTRGTALCPWQKYTFFLCNTLNENLMSSSAKPCIAVASEIHWANYDQLLTISRNVYTASDQILIYVIYSFHNSPYPNSSEDIYLFL